MSKYEIFSIFIEIISIVINFLTLIGLAVFTTQVSRRQFKNQENNNLSNARINYIVKFSHIIDLKLPDLSSFPLSHLKDNERKDIEIDQYKKQLYDFKVQSKILFDQNVTDEINSFIDCLCKYIDESSEDIIGELLEERDKGGRLLNKISYINNNSSVKDQFKKCQEFLVNFVNRLY